MSSASTYNASNDDTRERLRALLGRLSDDDLRRPLGDGWTVAAMLVHMAFYDALAAALLERYAASGALATSKLDVPIINAGTLPLCQAVPLRAAAELALRMAEAADKAVAALSPDQAGQIMQADWPVSLRRANHRGEHLDQIERALSA